MRKRKSAKASPALDQAGDLLDENLIEEDTAKKTDPKVLSKKDVPFEQL